MTPKVRIVAILAAATAVAAFVRRPVKRPETEGTWRPADERHTRR